MNHTQNDLTNVTLSIQNHLVAMKAYFKEGVQLTFIARVPENDNADIVMTTDDLTEISNVIERTKKRRPNYGDSEVMH